MNLLKSSILALAIGWCAAASATLVNFDINTPSSFHNQDINGTATTQDGGFTLKLQGNTWKSVMFNTTVTASTILYFDYKSEFEGELQGIGLDNNNLVNGSTLFKLFGTDPSSASTAHNNYAISDGWKEYAINVGSFFTGNFDRIVFINDDDSGPLSVNSFFRNVEICDGCQRTTTMVIAEPTSWMLLCFGAFGLYLRRYKK